MAITIKRSHIKLPDGFDPNRHAKKLPGFVRDQLGDGWEVENLDLKAGLAYATWRPAITEVTADTKDFVEGTLPRGTKPTDGERMAAKYENANPGFYMTEFSAHLGTYKLTRMEYLTWRARSGVALALGLSAKPWLVGVTPRADGGYDIDLPDTYARSKHDAGLMEVAEVAVGQPGWYITTDPRNLKASIIPGEPPTFPALIGYPFNTAIAPFRPGDKAWSRIPLGLKLPATGSDDYEEFVVDLEQSPHTLVSGISNSGKGVTINALIAGVLARGAELVVVDTPQKAVDFMWAKKFVRAGGWGCDSIEAAVTALALVYEEGDRRAETLAEYGVVKWTDLPADAQPAPLFVLVDELTALFMPEEVPKQLPRDDPMVLEPTQTNLIKATLKKHIRKTAAELRFVGIKLLLSSQVSQSSTGVGTDIRMNLNNKILLGVKATDGNRKLSLTDATAVPKVPKNIQADGDIGKGVGVAEMDGFAPCVFKSYFAEVDQYDSWLTSLGVPTTDQPSPTAQQIATFSPSLAIAKPKSLRTIGKPKPDMQAVALPGDEWANDPETGRPLTGFARANAARHELGKS